MVQGAGGLGKSAFCSEALKLYKRLGWAPLALWCTDVEQDPDRVEGLLRQFEMVGEEVLGESWGQVVAQLDRAAAAISALRQPAVRLGALLSVAADHGPGPLALYLDNLESLLVGPDNDDPLAAGEWRDPAAAELWRGRWPWAGPQG